MVVKCDTTLPVGLAMKKRPKGLVTGVNDSSSLRSSVQLDDVLHSVDGVITADSDETINALIGSAAAASPTKIVTLVFKRKVVAEKYKKRNSKRRRDYGQSIYKAGKTCAERVTSYHHLLHYKFRVFNRIKDQLLGERSSIEQIAAKSVNGQSIDKWTRKKKGGDIKARTAKELKDDEDFGMKEFDIYEEILASGEALRDGGRNTGLNTLKQIMRKQHAQH